MATRTRSAERFKYGVCLNDECSKCKSKDVQQIPMRKDFVCEECGKELRECQPPKRANKKPLIYAGIAVLAISSIVGGYCILKGESSEHARANIDSDLIAAQPDTTVASPTDTAETLVEEAKASNEELEKAKAEAEKAKAEAAAEKVQASASKSAKPAASSKGSGTLRLSYGTYVGATKNGYPHGQGRLTYSQSRQINRYDSKARTANAGDQVVGEFFNGFFINGKHLDINGNIIESVMIGVGDESSYDSK